MPVELSLRYLYLSRSGIEPRSPACVANVLPVRHCDEYIRIEFSIFCVHKLKIKMTFKDPIFFKICDEAISRYTSNLTLRIAIESIYPAAHFHSINYVLTIVASLEQSVQPSLSFFRGILVFLLSL